jgi:glutathione synthase/RimK-type ligase-like ATP-grasp enzyme
MLLFLDQNEDVHADWVEAECDKRGVPYMRFCTETFPIETMLSVHIANGEVDGLIRSPGREVPIAEITGIWYRRPGELTFDPALDETFVRFAEMEAAETLDGLYRVLWDRRWVSPPHALSAANHKIHQLRFARKLGFQTVPTLVTNDPEQALAFFHACGGAMIYKPLRQVAIAYADGNAYGIYTTLVTQENLEEHLDTIRYIPCLFQKLIPKKYELRINVIGDRVWTTAIYTQDTQENVLDWRPQTESFRHEPYLLPPTLEAKCLDLTRKLGLRMSNIDMIVTPIGEYIFLEVNPNGQWAWIEDMTGLPIATALVDELLGVDTLANHPYIKARSLHFAPMTAIKNMTTMAANGRNHEPVR